MEIIDKAVQSILTLVGTWMPVASQAKRETVFYDEGVIMFFKERARESLALRDDIPANVRTDLITFDTQHIDSIIHLYAVRIGHLTPEERARKSKGKADLTSIIMEDYIILAYALYVADKADAVTESTCTVDIIDMLQVCRTNQCNKRSSYRACTRAMSRCYQR
jgi:hypothetical protein